MLPDVLAKNLKVVFCGTAVGATSSRMGQYYAGPSNKFWWVLHEIRLTPYQLHPSEYQSLLEYGIGLTDLVKTKAGDDSALSKNDFGIDTLEQKILRYQPTYLCFNGKKAAKEFFSRSRVEFGLQKEMIGRTKIFILPSTSSVANASWDLEQWHDLAELCK